MGKKKKVSSEQRYSDPMMQVAHEALENLSNSPEAVEALGAVQRMLDAEDRHWATIFGKMEQDGVTLDELHEISESIREAIIKSPIIDRGAQLRHSYVWSKGIKLPEVSADPRPGAKTKVEKALSNPTNRRYFFDATAHEELERGLYSDGNVFALVDIKAGEARRIPLSEITDTIVNPDFAEEVWAWKREWNSTDDKTGKAEQKATWYYTDDCPLPKARRPRTQIRNTPVDHGKVIVSISTNRQIGWPLGIPDAVAAVVWAKLYSDFLKHGYVMSRALASIAFRATVTSRAGGENASMKLASTQGAGQTVVQGAANTLTALPTAGRGYDFNSGRPIAAMVATSVQVSIVHLLSDPGAAGSSYGSASNLDLPTKRAVVARQQSWVAFFRRLLAALGVDNAAVSFPSLEEPDFFREVQSIIAGWSTGLLHEEEVRARLVALLSIETDEKKAPEGVMLPNNEKSWARNDVDPKEDPNGGGGGASNDQGVGQGHSTGAGKGANANDIRTDGLGEAARMFGDMEVRDLLREVLERVSEVQRAQGDHS